MGENDSQATRGGGNLPPRTQQPTHPTKLEQVAKSIADLTKIAESAARIRRNSKDLVEVETDDLHHVIRDLRRVHDALRQEAPKDTLAKILENTEEIKRKVTEPKTTGHRLWSDIAAGGNAAQPVATAQIQRQQATEKRRDREVIVTVLDQMERDRAGSRPLNTILDSIRTKEPKNATDKAVALRQLPSKDYQIIMATEESKRTLETTDTWLQAIAPSARVKRTTYTVWAHGIRIQAIDADKQEEALATLRETNHRLHPDMDLVRVAWTKRNITSGKRYGSLIVETGNIETANRLISHGLVHEGEVKYCERFIKNARIIQCIRCNRFGHTIRVCRNQTTCGACAGEHHTKDCQKAATTRKCALCKGNHPAWDRACQYRLREVERAHLAIKTTPAFYERSPPNTAAIPTPAGASRGTSTPQTPQLIRRQVDDENGWQPVVRGRKGRPSQLTTAARAADQTRLEPSSLKRQRRDSTPIQEDGMETDVIESTQSQLLLTHSQ
jgi:hypothetical protein